MTSHLKLVPLQIRKDKKNFIVEDLSSGEFYEMPDVCIEAINMIQNDVLLSKIEQQLKQKYPLDEVDLLDFSEQLLDLGLIKEIDGAELQSGKNGRQDLGYEWISPKVGKFFFNKFTMILFLLFFIASITLLISHPNLFPRYKDIFIFKLMLVNIPVWMVLTFILVLIHEFGHILAVRSYNLPTKLEIGHRLFFVVLETDMSSVWKLDSKDRNKLYCAGLCFDTVMLFIALIGQLAFPKTQLLFHGILRMIVLDTFIRVVYQLCIYMKTDLYYVFENCTGCYNLMENAQQLFKRRFKISADDDIFESERKTVFKYAIFYIMGVMITILLYIAFYIPQLLYSFKKILPGFQNPISSLAFWDSTVFTAQVLIGFMLLVHSWMKKYRIRSS
jgi:hypothetical protein